MASLSSNFRIGFISAATFLDILLYCATRPNACLATFSLDSFSWGIHLDRYKQPGSDPRFVPRHLEVFLSVTYLCTPLTLNGIISHT